MTEQTRWTDVANRLDALALKLKMHFEQTGSAEAKEALRKLGDTVNEAFEAAGNAVRDDAVRADVREAGRLFADAVSATFAKVTGEVKEKVDRKS
jgi:hypothetical protein